MANVIMASTKTLFPTASSIPSPNPNSSPLPQFSLPKFQKPQVASALKSFSLVGAAAPLLMTPLHALVEEIEKVALFDFNLTLPIIMREFLLLMFALDKLYFSPLGNFMDERDFAIKEKLSSVKDTSTEVILEQALIPKYLKPKSTTQLTGIKPKGPGGSTILHRSRSSFSSARS